MSSTDYFRHPTIKLRSGAFAKTRVVLRDDFLSVEESAFVGYDEVQRIFYDQIIQVYRFAGRNSVGAPHYALSSLLIVVAVIGSWAAAATGGAVAVIFILPLPLFYFGWAIFRGLIVREVMLKIVHRSGSLVVPGARTAGGVGRTLAQRRLFEKLHIPVTEVEDVRALGQPQPAMLTPDAPPLAAPPEHQA